MQWLIGACLPLLLIPAWLYTITVARTRFPRLTNKRICLLIAHPDDEAMFFAPTLLALTQAELGNHVKILCLSSGEEEHLKETRKRELVKSSLALGLRSEDDVFVVEKPYVPGAQAAAMSNVDKLRYWIRDFQDGIKITWDRQKIADLLAAAFTAPQTQKQAPAATIDVLVTFDGQGVSGHPNHISLYHGAREFVASLASREPGRRRPVDLYALNSVSILRKYASIVDALTTTILALFQTRAANDADHPSSLVFISSTQEVRKAQQAMTQGHQSQMVWFRYGWIYLSRYLVVNDLQLV